MNFIIDRISNFFIQHPFAQVIAGFIGKIVGCLFVLLMFAACLFLALGKKHCYQFPQGSVSGLFWKAGWLLQIVAVDDLSYRRYDGTTHISVAELVFDCIPTVLLVFSMLYSAKHDKVIHAERRQTRDIQRKADKERR